MLQARSAGGLEPFRQRLDVVTVVRSRACHDESVVSALIQKDQNVNALFLPSGLHLTRPREEASPMRCPRCLPSSVNPREGWRVHNLSPGCGLCWEPFQSSRFGPFDEVTEPRRTRVRALGVGEPTPCWSAPAAPPTTSAFGPFREIGRAHV